MAKRLDVSLKEIRAYEAQIDCFRDNLEYECAMLMRAFQGLDNTLDRETSEAFWPYIESIRKTIFESSKVVDQLEARVRKCALIVEKVERSNCSEEVDETEPRKNACEPEKA